MFTASTARQIRFLAGTAPLLAILAACSNQSSSTGPISYSRPAEAATGTPGSPATTQRPVAAAQPAPVAKSRAGTFAVIDGQEAPIPPILMGDPTTVARIIDEGKNRNKVMDHLRTLSVTYGPRLTGSTNIENAQKWAVEQFQAWGLANARMEKWGEIGLRFDRGPSNVTVKRKVTNREDGSVTFEALRECEFTAPAWSRGTEGAILARVIRMPETEEDYEALKDELKGAWVLQSPIVATGENRRGIRSLRDVNRRNRNELREKVASGELDPATLPPKDRILFAGIAGFLTTTQEDRVWTSSVGRDLASMKLETLPTDLEVTLRGPDYDFINSRLADGDVLHLDVNLDHTLTPGPIPVYNVIAEIPGTTKPDEIVVISAHLDSWNGPGSMGTLDNGTGSSVMMEAARILAASRVRPERTIRVILWSGEEQGLLGSRAYVESLGENLKKIQVCLVDDGGSNYQGGLPVPDTMVDVMAAATAPVNGVFYSETDKKELNVDIHRTGQYFETIGASDHYSFTSKGRPGFFWDEVGRSDYRRGWHTQYDRIDLAVPEYLVQSSTCTAVTAFNLACTPEMLPDPVEKPREPRPARN